MTNALESNNIAILAGKGDFVDGAAVIAALNNGVTRFVDGDEADEPQGPVAVDGYDWE